MKICKVVIIWIVFLLASPIIAQNIPSQKVIAVENLSDYLKPEVEASFSNNSEITTSELAQYFRGKFSERYFYNWKNFDNRFAEYQAIYPDAESGHKTRALDHMSKYDGVTPWKLPFNYLFEEPVDAYALRHLARQHKMVDIAFYYNYENQNATYLNYFKNQLQSLNLALHADDYEKIEDGNGVYEAFRSGYRILNWLQIHNMFLGQEHYSDEDQLTTIATLLQHGANLFENNQKFHSGNHQTRGLSALAMVSILLRDFVDTEEWYQHAMKLLEEHLVKEINDDGFQFERTVHYHMSDIGNYYYVYQLAKTSDLKVGQFWEDKLKSLFTTLIKVAYPDKSAPVLSDDTDEPWAERNDISGAMTLGYLLFEDPEMGYFANNHVEAKMYWYINDAQLKQLNAIQTKTPEYKSSEFPTTGYYIMRDGWNENDNMMIVSAGLDALKPDHQHGDMLGVQAMANGHVVLPNYQVRYYLKDLELFKNSMTKNVALVDDELQGKQYTSNKGGSGFGKFKSLPQPKTIAFNSNDDLDVFIGSHNGFENIGVDYSRQVIYLKNDFWIVKDNFKSEKPHTYKQIWQGHYSLEHSPKLLRSSFENGSGLDVFQLNGTDEVNISGQRGKEWATVSTQSETDYSFITIVYPFSTFDERINEDSSTPNLKGWTLNYLNGISVAKNNLSLYFSAEIIELKAHKLEFSESVDVSVKQEGSQIQINLLSANAVTLTVSKKDNKTLFSLTPGKEIIIRNI